MPKKKTKTPARETDLYEPIQAYLTAQGYTVRSEVLGCDIAATRGDELILVEMKRQFSLDLLYQAIGRQRTTDSVYVAIPRPDDMGWGKRWKNRKRLLRQLELGLIVVSFGAKTPLVEVAFHPTPFARKKQRAKRRAVLTEMAGRSADRNRGGSRGRPLVTAYREQALRIACYLERLGPQSPKALRALGTGQKTTTILHSNVYGWFEHIGRALYALSPQGRDGLADYPDLVRQFQEDLEQDS